MAINDKSSSEYGPSWRDVEQYGERIQTQHDCSLVVTLLPQLERGKGVWGWIVYAKAHPPKRLAEQALQCGTSTLRGNRGAKTLPAALYMALMELDEKLKDHGGQAQLPGF